MKAPAQFILALCLSFSAAHIAAAQQERAGAPTPGQTAAAATSTGNELDQMGVQGYLLGPGDILDVRVFGEPNFSSLVEVDDRGNVQIPFIAPVPARCRTEQDVRKDIAKALTKYLNEPQVSVRIAERKSRPPAVVFGAVRAPQRVQMLRRVRLMELLAVSGGLTEQAGSTVQVFHTTPLLCPDAAEAALEAAAPDAATVAAGDDPLEAPFSVYSLAELKVGKDEANPLIRPGDIVIVQEAPPVYVTGAVVSPQGVYLRDKLTLTRAIAMVGGLKKEAKDQIRVYRQRPGSTEQQTITIDFDAIRKQKQPDFELQAYDIIEVGEASAFSGKRLGQTLLGIATGGLQSFGTNLPTRVLY